MIVSICRNIIVRMNVCVKKKIKVKEMRVKNKGKVYYEKVTALPWHLSWGLPTIVGEL